MSARTKLREGDMVCSVNPKGLVGIIARIMSPPYPGYPDDEVEVVVVWLNPRSYGAHVAEGGPYEQSYPMRRAIERREAWLAKESKGR